jgi:hypothetical protein
VAAARRENLTTEKEKNMVEGSGKEAIRLVSIFGGDPEEAGRSGRSLREEHQEFIDSVPLLMPAAALPDSVRDSHEGQEYQGAEADFQQKLKFMQNVLSGEADIYQDAYNTTLCEQARLRLFRAASAPAIQTAFRGIADRKEAELRAAETPLPEPPANGTSQNSTVPEIGDLDGGGIYVGKSATTRKDLHAALADEPEYLTFEEALAAAEHLKALHPTAHVPTPDELDENLFDNRFTGHLKDTFNTSGSHPGSVYRSCAPYNHVTALVQWFDDGYQSFNHRSYRLPVRLVW